MESAVRVHVPSPSNGSSSYVLGVDGLPLGDQAAVAVAGRVVAELTAVGRLLPDRVAEAVRLAAQQMGDEPAEVRLLCVDGGGDGTELHQIRAWLADRSITLIVLDPAELTLPAQPPPDAAISPAEQSVSRARSAALW